MAAGRLPENWGAGGLKRGSIVVPVTFCSTLSRDWSRSRKGGQTMPRSIVESPTWQPSGAADRELLTLDLRLITPMFGGGYEPREIHAQNPIRAASIRGHLRFWWRAVVGARFTDPAELFRAEQALWGSAERPGQVAVTVRDVRHGGTHACGRYTKNREGRYPAIPDFEGKPGYALYPFQGKALRDRIEEEPASD